MKKILFLLLFSLCTLGIYAQNDVTKFLGIPIDGTKENMIKKIEKKGFKYNQVYDCLEGEFNGRNVYIYVATIKNKVYRIYVADKISVSESQIKIRYNNLCAQFSRSDKYVAVLGEDFSINDNEDISREILLNKKNYQAAFWQLPDPDRKKLVWFKIHKNSYDEYEICMYYDNLYNQNTDDDI